jgi:hypothetical protein
VLITVIDERTGVEHRFPATVCWRRDQTAMGVRFEGIPLELRHRRLAPAVDLDGAD